MSVRFFCCCYLVAVLGFGDVSGVHVADQPVDEDDDGGRQDLEDLEEGEDGGAQQEAQGAADVAQQRDGAVRHLFLDVVEGQVLDPRRSQHRSRESLDGGFSWLFFFLCLQLVLGRDPLRKRPPNDPRHPMGS